MGTTTRTQKVTRPKADHAGDAAPESAGSKRAGAKGRTSKSPAASGPSKAGPPAKSSRGAKAAPKSAPKSAAKPAGNGTAAPAPAKSRRPAKGSAKGPVQGSTRTAPRSAPATGKSAKPVEPKGNGGKRAPAAAARKSPAGDLVEVRKSPIHGKGLFATRRIAKGALIGVYEGPRSRKIDTYVLWVEGDDGKEYGIDGKNEMRFVNHSSKPNASFEGEELWSLRRIEPGEEITHHYGDDWEDL